MNRPDNGFFFRLGEGETFPELNPLNKLRRPSLALQQESATQSSVSPGASQLIAQQIQRPLTPFNDNTNINNNNNTFLFQNQMAQQAQQEQNMERLINDLLLKYNINSCRYGIISNI